MRGEIHIEVEAVGQEHVCELHFPGDGVTVLVALHDGLHDLVADTERRDVLDLARKPYGECVGVIADIDCRMSWRDGCRPDRDAACVVDVELRWKLTSVPTEAEQLLALHMQAERFVVELRSEKFR